MAIVDPGDGGDGGDGLGLLSHRVSSDDLRELGERILVPWMIGHGYPPRALLQIVGYFLQVYGRMIVQSDTHTVEQTLTAYGDLLHEMTDEIVSQLRVLAINARGE